MIGRWVARVPPTVLVLLAILSSQFGAGLARTQFDAVGSLGATFLRLLFAAIILLAVLRPRMRTWTRRAWLSALLLGVALAGMNTMIYLAFETVPLGVAVTIEFLGPLVLALTQTRRFTDALWAVLALVGVVLLGFDLHGSIGFIGLVFAAGAGTFWAGYILASANVGRNIPGIDGLAVAMAIGAVLAAPLGWHGAVAAVQQPLVLVAFVGVAALSSALPYALELTALRRIPTRIFGVLSSLGPAVAAIAGFVVLRQALGLQQITALLLVTIASIGITLAGGRREKPRLEPLG
ncbi:DMT family transporter [Glaciihabitans sp. dw_435]|uniref:EamA family transporter n=1 Tax=Glaciihabitans sp. dw_435 TaxID=2720081 RepID=UPI001BD4D35A|nr:EamA family transporter [Glaciihabitans sp. dw_435]